MVYVIEIYIALIKNHKLFFNMCRKLMISGTYSIYEISKHFYILSIARICICKKRHMLVIYTQDQVYLRRTFSLISAAVSKTNQICFFIFPDFYSSCIYY